MPRTRVLIVYGASGDSSVDLARQLVLALGRRGVHAEACAAEEVPDLEQYDGVALEGAREGAGWTLFARDFARRHAGELKNLPAWFLPSTRGCADLDVCDQSWWARAIARGLGGPSGESRLIAWGGTLRHPARPLPN
jgi:menaquinone-dependent protoporphyrinogen IX oxidase